jgi:hypothetical protein
MILCFIAVGFVSAESIASSSNLKVTLINQEPDPVTPGSIVDVKLRVENMGSGVAENVIIEFIPEYPFSIRPGDSVSQNIGTIGGRQTGDDGVIVEFKLKVDKDAVQGDNDLKVKYKTGIDTWVIPEPFAIRVKTPVAVLDAASIITVPSVIVPGEPAKINLVLKNYADSLMSNVNVKFDFVSSSIPIAPLYSTSEKVLKNIAAGEEVSIAFDVVALADAEAGIYKVPLNISYYDSSGALYSKSGVVGIVVGASPDIVALVSESEIKKEKMSGNVDIKFTNKGMAGIKFLNVKLKETDQFSVISSPEVYIGKVDSDDYETASFNIYVKSSDDGKVILPVDMEYRDSTNKLFTETRNVELRIFSSSSNGNNIAGPIITLVIVAAGVGIYFWAKKRKKK